MIRQSRADGFSFVELLVSLGVLTLIMGLVASIVVHNAKLNKAQQMRVEVQSNARSALALVTQTLRSAGWDPSNAGVTPVGLDSNLGDSINYIDVFADLNGDGDVADTGETVRIQHNGDRVEWRRSSGAAFETVGVHLTNDLNGDGTPEPMFVANSSPNPTSVTVRITGTSAVQELQTGEFFRYTVSNAVAIRNNP